MSKARGRKASDAKISTEESKAALALQRPLETPAGHKHEGSSPDPNLRDKRLFSVRQETSTPRNVNDVDTPGSQSLSATSKELENVVLAFGALVRKLDALYGKGSKETDTEVMWLEMAIRRLELVSGDPLVASE